MTSLWPAGTAGKNWAVRIWRWLQPLKGSFDISGWWERIKHSSRTTLVKGGVSEVNTWTSLFLALPISCCPPPHQPNLKEGRGQRSLTVHLLKVSSWSKQRSSKDWKLKWGGEIENNLSTGLSLVRRCGLSGGKGRRICNVHRISKLFSLKDCSNSHPVHSCTWMLLPHSLSSHLLSNG